MIQHLHLTCQREQFRHVLKLLETLLVPYYELVCLLDHGLCEKQAQAFVVLQWDGEVESTVLAHLNAHPLVTAVSVYTPLLPEEALDGLARLRAQTALDELEAKEGAPSHAQY